MLDGVRLLESVPVGGALVCGVLVDEVLVGGVLVSVPLAVTAPLAAVSVDEESAEISRFFGSASTNAHRYAVMNAASSMMLSKSHVNRQNGGKN